MPFDHAGPRIFRGLTPLLLPLVILGLVATSCGRVGIGGGPDPFRAPTASPSQVGMEGSDSLAADGLVVGLPEREPLAGAEIRFLDRDEEEVTSATSDAEGRFHVGPTRIQSYTLVVSAAGFEEFRDRIDFRGLSPAFLNVELAVAGDTLSSGATLTVATSYLTDVGFFSRKATQSGFFLTGAEIRERAPANIVDLFRTAPGFRIQQGGVLAGRRGCPPTVYVDGREMGSARFLEQYVFWRDIEGLEGYASQFPPAAFLGAGCGSVVIWTRRGIAR
jgi:hypothetical protein